MIAEWILGDGADGIEYLVHTESPRFWCKIGDLDEHIDGLTIAINEDEVIYEIVWLDPPVTDYTELGEIGRQAREAINQIMDSLEECIEYED